MPLRPFAIHRVYHDEKNIYNIYHIKFSMYTYIFIILYCLYSLVLLIVITVILFNLFNLSFFPVLYASYFKSSTTLLNSDLDGYRMQMQACVDQNSSSQALFYVRF